MRRSNRSAEPALLRDESGAAALEFVVVGLVLLVPLVYLVLALGEIQDQALGVQAGASTVARTVATAPDAASARDRAERALDAVVDEYGLDRGAVSLALSCTPDPRRCPEAGAYLTVTVATRVGLPLVPPVLGLDRVASVPVEATATQKVSRFWSER
jgi:Flp pilus assembly protein TadG